MAAHLFFNLEKLIYIAKRYISVIRAENIAPYQTEK
jgi:hypothetical protein